MDYEKLLNMAAELGYQLMYSGAEIYRVEESVRRLLHAYGLPSPEVFAIPNCIIVSLTTASSPLHILPASRDALEEQLSLPGTKVLMKSGKQLPQAAEALRRKGLLEKAAMVRDCGLPTEQVCRDLQHLRSETGYFATVIVKE